MMHNACTCCNWQVGEQFLQLQDDTWVVLDAGQDIEDLHAQVSCKKGERGKGAGHQFLVLQALCASGASG
jgi:hypothetical protein